MNNVFALAGVVIKELYRRKDFYVLFVMTALITVLLGSVKFFHDDNVARYLKDACSLLVWISSLVIAITTTARQIPAERESRTIFPLLAKPVSRAQLICGKFLGCWVACGISLLVFYFFFGLVTASREHALSLELYAQALGLHWLCLAIVVSMVMLGSVVFTAPSSNATISFVLVLGIMFCARHLNVVAIRMGGFSGNLLYWIYYCVPHLEWYDLRDFLVHNWPPVSWAACVEAALYAGVYSAFLLGLACVVFRRKTLTV